MAKRDRAETLSTLFAIDRHRSNRRHVLKVSLKTDA